MSAASWGLVAIGLLFLCLVAAVVMVFRRSR